MKKLIMILSILPLILTLQAAESYRLPGLETDLLEGIVAGDLAKVKDAISSGADVNARNEFGITAAFLAGIIQSREIADELFKHGASPFISIAEPNEQTNPRVTIVNPPFSNLMDLLFINLLLSGSLLDNATKIRNIINKTDESGSTALIYAAARHDVFLVKLLLTAEANPNIKDNNGNTALIYACYTEGDNGLKVINALIKAKADLNAPDQDGDTPLTIATKFNYNDMAKILYKAGALLRDDIEDHIKERIYNELKAE